MSGPRSFSPCRHRPVDRGIFAVIVVLLGLMPGARVSRAQTYDQVAPKSPPAAGAAHLPANVTPPQRTRPSGDQVVIPSLRGLVFLTDPRALQPHGSSAVGVNAEGERLLATPEFRSLAGAWLGRSVTLGDLDLLTRDVVLYFRRHGRPVVDVFVPEQNVASGTVQILVIEGRLGAVRVEGNHWFSSDQIRAAIRGRTGEIIEGAPLLEDLAWLNENAFREVDLVFMRGHQPGETDLVLRTRDRRPVRGYVGYEDSGNALTGYDRLLFGANLGNAWGVGQQANYQLTVSPDGRKLVAHSASYIVPLQRWRDTLTVFGSYAESRPELPEPFALKGRSAQLSGRFRIPLRMRAMWSGAVTGGVDFKRSNNDLAFGGTQVFAQETDVIQGLVTLAVSHLDRRGSTSAELTVVGSPGGLDNANREPAYGAARALARPDYAYARLTLDRRTTLPHGMTWVTWAMAQYASANLLGSEQLGLGGADALRGYEEREANGDNGFVLVNELHAPLLHLVPMRKQGSTKDGLDPLVFLDYGRVSSHERLPGEPAGLELASAGLGFRYQLGSALSARLDYGWQLKRSGTSPSGRTSRAHVSVTVGF